MVTANSIREGLAKIIYFTRC